MRFNEQGVLGVFVVVLMGGLLRAVLVRETMAVPFLVAVLVLPILMRMLSYSQEEMMVRVVNSLWSFRILFGIIMLMGVTISLWLLSGAVPSMIYYSMGLLSKMNIVLLSFLITTGFSLVIGTALGTISTFGIALLAIGKSAGVSSSLLLGAIVSGAFMADRLSPVAGLVNLNLTAHAITFAAYFKASYKRIAIAFVVSAIAFYYLGLNAGSGGGDAASRLVTEALKREFVLTPWLLGIPLVVAILSFVRMPILAILGCLTLFGSGVAVVIQGNAFSALIHTILWGYKSTDPLLMDMLKGGGLIPFLEVVIVVACAVVLSSLLELSTSYQNLSRFFLSRVKDKKSLRLQIGLMSIALTSATCDQTIGIVTPAFLYKEKSKQYGLLPEEQASAIGDTGVIIAPLEPWNVNALVITAMTGLTVADYGIYSFFLIFLIILYFLELLWE